MPKPKHKKIIGLLSSLALILIPKAVSSHHKPDTLELIDDPKKPLKLTLQANTEDEDEDNQKVNIDVSLEVTDFDIPHKDLDRINLKQTQLNRESLTAKSETKISETEVSEGLAQVFSELSETVPLTVLSEENSEVNSSSTSNVSAKITLENSCSGQVASQVTSQLASQVASHVLVQDLENNGINPPALDTFAKTENLLSTEDKANLIQQLKSLAKRQRTSSHVSLNPLAQGRLNLQALQSLQNLQNKQSQKNLVTSSSAQTSLTQEVTSAVLSVSKGFLSGISVEVSPEVSTRAEHDHSTEQNVEKNADKHAEKIAVSLLGNVSGIESFAKVNLDSPFTESPLLESANFVKPVDVEINKNRHLPQNWETAGISTKADIYTTGLPDTHPYATNHGKTTDDSVTYGTEDSQDSSSANEHSTASSLFGPAPFDSNQVLNASNYVKLVNLGLDSINSPYRLPEDLTVQYVPEIDEYSYCTRFGSIARFEFYTKSKTGAVIEARALVNLEKAATALTNNELRDILEMTAIITTFIAPDGKRYDSIVNLNTMMRESFSAYYNDSTKQVVNGNIQDFIRYNVDIIDNILIVYARPNSLAHELPVPKDLTKLSSFTTEN